MKKAVVNKIIPFSCVDGPGNRTAVFLQGCNIDCKYCHNPETRGMCTGCGICVEKCPRNALSRNADGTIRYQKELCVECDTCIHVCPNNSSPRTSIMTAEEVYEQVKKQIPFIRGITVSGGECMLRPDFLARLFELAKKEGLETLIDSNGTISFEEYPELMKVTDGVMLDIKAFDNKDFYNVTGADNEMVLQNAGYLAKTGKLDEVRVVVVQDLYDACKSVEKIGEFLANLCDVKKIRVKLIAYRPMGVREEYSHYQVPEQKLMEQLSDVLKAYGFEKIIII